jgi:flagellar motor switch protein FliM
MSKVLSAQEIEALLNSASELTVNGVDADTKSDAAVLAYNFRRPDRVSKDQIRALHFLHDRFARNVSTSVSAYLRAVTTVSVTGVEQLSYAEFVMSLADPTAFYALSMAPFEGLAAFELNPNVAFSIVDRMLGGSGTSIALSRALTEIEQHVIDDVVKLMIDTLTETWRGIVDVHFSVTGRETRPQVLQVAAANEVVLQVGFDMRLGETRGMLNLCIPASMVDSINTGVVQTWNRTRREATERDRRHLLESLGRVSLPVAAQLDAELKARELLRLKPGDVVSLGLPATEPLELLVRGTVKFKGRLTTVAGHAALKVEARRPSAHSGRDA